MNTVLTDAIDTAQESLAALRIAIRNDDFVYSTLTYGGGIGTDLANLLGDLSDDGDEVWSPTWSQTLTHLASLAAELNDMDDDDE